MFIRAIFIVILTFIYAFCNAQSENIITYGTNQQESASNILRLPDGTLLIGARASNNKFELLHIQDNGIVLNQVQLENTRSITQLILLSDNNILVAGSEGTSENNAIVLLKLDLLLNIIWSKKIQSTHMVYSYSVKELQNNDIVIAGYSSVDGTSNSNWDCLMVRLRNNGDLKWKKIVKTSNGSDWLLDLVELPNGNIVFIGASVVSSVDFLLLKTDANGTILKSSSFGSDQNEVIYSVLLVNNKLILNAGSWSFGIGEYDLVYSRCDTNFNVEFTKVYGGNKFDFPFCSSFENNEVTISGYSRSFSSNENNDIVLFSFNTNGDITRKKKIGLTGTEYSYTKGQLYTRNNSLIYMTGETSSYGKGMGDIFFATINTEANCCEFVNEIVVLEQTVNLNTNTVNIILEDLNLNSFTNFISTKTTPTQYAPTLNCVLSQLNASIILNNTSLCINSPISFLANSATPGLTFDWNFGDPSSGTNNISANENPTHVFSNPGIYMVTLIVSNGCVSDTDELSVTIINSIDIETQISSNINVVCMSDTVKFSSITNDNNVSYFWSFNDPSSGINNISDLANPIHVFNNVGTYDVLLITLNECHIDSDIITINVVDNLVADFNYNIDSCLGILKLSSSLPSNNIFNWYVNNEFTNAEENPSITLDEKGNYSIKLVINPQSNCSDTIEKTINYSNVSSQLGLLIPNAFSPNGDGINDVYEVIGNVNCEVKRMIVFNRWGGKIYESDSIFKWNGKNKSVESPVGTYILYLEFENEKIVKTINLLQ